MAGSAAAISRTEDGAEALERLLLLLRAAASLEDVVAALRGGMRAAVGADGIAVVLRDKDLVSYHAEDAIGPLWTGLAFPIRSCITGHAILDDATIVVPNILVDPRIPQVAYRPTFVRSLVTVPVGSPDPFASLGAYWAHIGWASDAAIAAMEAIAAGIPAAARGWVAAVRLPSRSTGSSRAR